MMVTPINQSYSLPIMMELLALPSFYSFHFMGGCVKHRWWSLHTPTTTTILLQQLQHQWLSTLHHHGQHMAPSTITPTQTPDLFRCSNPIANPTSPGPCTTVVIMTIIHYPTSRPPPMSRCLVLTVRLGTDNYSVP